MSGYIGSWSAGWWPYFGAALAQNTLFLAVVLLVLRRLRDASASVRAAVATAAIAKLVLPPLLPLQSLFSHGSTSAVAAAGNLFSFTFLEAGGTSAPGAPSGVGPGAIAVLMLVWATGAALLLGHTLLSTVRFSRVLRGSSPVPDAEIPGAARLAGVDILASARIAMPLTFGIFPRRVYVPAAAWRRWTPRCREMVVRHELAHIRRRDGVVQVFQAIARSIYFFHPLVWILDRRLGEYREMACDDASSRHGSDEVSEYSRYLVEIAASLAGRKPPCMTASAFIRRRNELLRRVRYQLAERRAHMMSVWKKAALAAGLVILVAALSWYRGGVSAQEGKPAEAGARQETEGSVHITATLKNDGSIVTVTKGDARKVTDLGKAFAGQIEYDSKKTVVELHCEDGVTMDRVYALQQEMQKRGIARIRYALHEKGGVPLNLPPREMLDRLADMPEENLCRVHVDGSGAYRVDGKKIRDAEVSGSVVSRISANDALVVMIQTDADTPFAAFVGALVAVTGAGAERVAIMPPAKSAE